MKIITWNCNMAYRKKAEFILAQRPDIVVVPECEHPGNLKFKAGTPLPTDVVWHGTNPHKGLGVLAYNGYKLRLLDSHNPDFKHVLPIAVTDGDFEWMLFAIWANNPLDKDGTYVTQVWKAMHFYEELIRGERTILAGDFNSNTIWDQPRRAGNHSTVVEKLGAKNIFSAYHQFFGQEQGREAHPTLYLYRHADKPYHLDYCFASVDMLAKLQRVEVGTFPDWAAYSDHMPLSVTFDF